jgi:hypothetical protein
MSLHLDGEANRIACLNLRYSVRLTHDAARQARQMDKRGFAAEKEARNFVGHFNIKIRKTYYL